MDFESAKQRSLDEAILFLGYARGKGTVGRPQLLRASRAGGIYAFRWRLGGVVVEIEMEPDTGEFITIERLEDFGSGTEDYEEPRAGLRAGAWLGGLMSIVAIGLLIDYLSSTSLSDPQNYLMALLKVAALALFYLLGLYWALRLFRTTRKMPVLYSVWFVLALAIAFVFHASKSNLVQIPALIAALIYLLLAISALVANRGRA